MQETQIWSLGQEDPLEEKTATHSSILAWKIPWTEEPSRLQSKSLQREESDVTEQLTHTHPKQKEAKWDKKYDYLEVMRRWMGTLMYGFCPIHSILNTKCEPSILGIQIWVRHGVRLWNVHNLSDYVSVISSPSFSRFSLKFFGTCWGYPGQTRS